MEIPKNQLAACIATTLVSTLVVCMLVRARRWNAFAMPACTVIQT